ncbi:hypothetical protein KB976_004364 [Vibrio parahaemolyticus]|nr:hypothetical protein [Vibrio parahaemolyticus]
MALEKTHYDVISKLRPEIIKYAALDADLIRNIKGDYSTIHTIDEYSNSNFSLCLEIIKERLITDLSKDTGLSKNEIHHEFNRNPDLLTLHLDSIYMMANYEYHSIVNFELSGRKTFFFNNNLVEHLANTDINVNADGIHMPFASCLFVYTAKEAIDAMHNIKTTDEIQTHKQLNYNAPISVFLTIHDTDDINLPGRKIVITAWHGKGSVCYYMLKREIYLGTGWTLEQALRTDWERLTPENVNGGISVNIDNQEINENLSDEIFYQDGLLFFRIILNSILYLDSDEAELVMEQSTRLEIEKSAKQTKSVAKRKKKLKEAEKFSSLSYANVGHSIQPIIINKTRVNDINNAEEGSGRVSTYRFIVRGHWKQQVYGPKRSLRKKIRIAPYYRGDDVAQLINKPYLVK